MAGQMLLLSANPKKRGGKKRRSAAQRAATARMLAANRAKGGHSPKKRRKSRRSSFHSVARRAGKRARGFARGLNFNSIKSLAMNGAIGGAGAIATDIAMGYGASLLPASVVSRVNADGSMNYMYYGVKGALAVALGTLGGKVLPPAIAARMAEGSLTVMSYEILRGMMPASVSLGYMNPAATLQRIVRTGAGYNTPALPLAGNVRRIMPTATAVRTAAPMAAGRGR